MFEVQSAEQFH